MYLACNYHVRGHPWIYDIYLCNVVSYVYITDLRLCDIFDNGVWNFNKLYTQLPPLYFYWDCLLDHDIEDKLIWSGASNGKYSTSLGYKWLDHLLHQQVTPIICWNWIWHLPISDIKRHFCWLVMQGSLPTIAFNGSNHLTTDTTCHRCGALLKTIFTLFMIVLVLCPFGGLSIQIGWLNFSSKIVKLGSNIMLLLHRESGPLLILTCWKIWRNRNEEIFLFNK